MNISTIIRAYIAACHSGDKRSQRILADQLSIFGIDADLIWNQQ
jgi:hypothetical protein